MLGAKPLSLLAPSHPANEYPRIVSTKNWDFLVIIIIVQLSQPAICFFNLPPYRFIRIEFDDGFARLDVVYNARATIISSHKVRRIIVNPVDGRGNKSTSAAGITGKSLEERRGMR